MAILLIIDDDTSAATALATLLQREGHEAAVACDASEALRQLRQGVPDLVLLDLEMPRVDGLHLLEALKEEPRFTDVPVAVLSGLDDPIAVNVAEELGAVDFIVKGGDWPSLYARIRSNLPAQAAPV